MMLPHGWQIRHDLDFVRDHDIQDDMARWTLVKFLRAQKHEFDIIDTWVERSLLWFRLSHALIRRLLHSDIDFEHDKNQYYQISSIVQTTTIRLLKLGGSLPDFVNHHVISMCDQNLAVEVVEKLTRDELYGIFNGGGVYGDSNLGIGSRSPELIAFFEKKLAILKQFVTLTALTEVKVTEGFKVHAETTFTSAYDKTGISAVKFSICAMDESGVRIEPVDQTRPRLEAVCTIKNEMAGKVVKLTSEDKTHSISHNSTYLLYVHELAKPVTVTVEDAPPPPPPSPPQPAP